MGKIYTDVLIENGIDVYRAQGDGAPETRRVSVRALVDTGTTALLIAADMARSLGLRTMRRDRYELADGSMYEGEVVGPARVTVEGRSFFYEVGLLPDGAEPLLGVVALEQLDLILDPKTRRVVGRDEGGPMLPLKKNSSRGCCD